MVVLPPFPFPPLPSSSPQISLNIRPSLTNPGGTLAHFLTSTTPTHHTSRSFTPHLPYSLTGLDATLFSVLSSLNLRPSIHPILGDEAWDEWDEWRMQHFFDRDHDQDEDNEFQEFLASRQNIWRVGEKFSRVRMLDLVLQHSDDPTPVRLCFVFPCFSFCYLFKCRCGR